MPRTAPVPNIPAIPGMNPGAWVKGGGAGGGGGSGNGKGGKNGQGANGNNGGDGVDGDGRGAGSCGPGSGGGCGNPSHGGDGTHAGDPVDPLTGRVYTLPQVDLPLVGPIPFRIERAYSSFARDRNVGLGFGWSHSLAWSIEVRRRTMRIETPFAGVMLRALPKVGETITLRGAGRLRRSDARMDLIDEQQRIHRFEPRPGKPAHFRLVAIHDRPGNVITLHEDQAGHLVAITDSAGRRVTVRRDSRGYIEGYELLTSAGRRVCHRRIEVDDGGDLVATVDALGRRVSFAYDDEHRLLREQQASGLTAHFKYDRAGRCVESWTDYGGATDLALDDDVPAVLADGTTRARGMLHVRLEYEGDFTHVHDSRMTRRIDRGPRGGVGMVAGIGVEKLSRDANGAVTSYDAPNERTTLYTRDGASRVTGVQDPLGGTLTRSYDRHGQLVESVDALGQVLRYSYDGAGNLRETADALGILLQTSYDARGLPLTAEMPNGAVTRFQYDAAGNLTALTEPNGRTRTFEVDDLGRITAFTDEEGKRTGYHYDAMNGLRAVSYPNGAVDAFELDADGRLSSYTAPDGGVWRLLWGGYHCVHTVLKPTGETLRFFYDREAQLARIVNERGETHRIGRDLAGRIVSEEHFDGRQYRYWLDPAGRLVKIENGAGETTELEHDAAGRLVRRVHVDDFEEAFEVDAGGRLTRSSTGHVTCEWTYDGRGNVVRERQTCEGRSVAIEHTYNAANQRIATRTSLGYAVGLELDLMGRATRVHLGGGSIIQRVYDGLGREVMRGLPRGGHIVSRYDGIDRLVERRIARGQGQVESGAPAWIGALPPGTTFAEGFVRAANGDVVEHATSDGVHDRFAYDLAGRVAERISRSGAREAYAYGGAGCTLELQGQPRAYGRGGALLSRGAVTYAYDPEGRRSRKVEGAGVATSYHYDARGHLAAVVLPDGTRVENVYDTQGRRILKRVVEPGGARRDTRFVWADDVILEEETWRIEAGVPPVRVSARHYVTDAGGAMLAHRNRTWVEGQVLEGDWVHYALGPGDCPELLVSGEGAVVARFRASLWGALTVDAGASETTPWRFRGQYFDEETGLCQNRFRFYDPETGLFISTDPTGIQGALASYEYADSRPHRMVDPDGLAGFMVSTIEGSAGTGSGKSGRSGTGDLHQVVKDALPPKVNGDGNASPGECAEPKALSNYIKEWEKKNGKLDPNDKPRVKECLDSISSVKANERKSGKARSPCPNCSQMFANLQAKFGAPSASVIQPGATTPDSGIPGPTNFEPPDPSYKGSAHASYPVP